jgi:penicillin-binding protein-related factor A (putative recombinase)
MAVNRGKQFEDVIRVSFEKVEDIVIVRLHDQTNGFAGSKNPCDFIVYKKPVFMAIECKAVHGNTLPFSNITDFQWTHLSAMGKTKGVVAGVICWWVDKDVTLFLPIQMLQRLKANDNKSIRYDCSSFDIVPISGKKKHVFFDYDMELFLQEVSKWEKSISMKI